MFLGTIASVTSCSGQNPPASQPVEATPTISSISGKTTILAYANIEYSGSDYIYTAVTNINNAKITYQLVAITPQTLPTWININATSGKLTYTNQVSVGDYSVKIVAYMTIMDNKYTCEKTVNINVVTPPEPHVERIDGDENLRGVSSETGYSSIYSATTNISTQKSIDWDLTDAPTGVTVVKGGQIKWTGLTNGSYTFSIGAKVNNDDVLIKKTVNLTISATRPAPSLISISGPTIIHALKSKSSTDASDTNIDDDLTYTTDVSPYNADQNITWSLKNGTVDETAQNPYHTEYSAADKNNIVPSWLSIDQNGKVSWTDAAVPAKDPLIGRYINWRFIVCATSTANTNIHTEFPIGFMVSKRSGGWANPTTIGITTVGSNYTIDAEESNSGQKQYYSHADAGTTILETDVYQTSSWKTTGAPAWISIDKYGMLSWTNNIYRGTYTFNMTVTSKKITTITYTHSITIRVSASNTGSKIESYLAQFSKLYNKCTPMLKVVGNTNNGQAGNIANLMLAIDELFTSVYEAYTYVDVAYKNSNFNDQTVLRQKITYIYNSATNPALISSVKAAIASAKDTQYYATQTFTAKTEPTLVYDNNISMLTTMYNMTSAQQSSVILNAISMQTLELLLAALIILVLVATIIFFVLTIVYAILELAIFTSFILIAIFVL